jgi:hypothetical protein
VPKNSKNHFVAKGQAQSISAGIYVVIMNEYVEDWWWREAMGKISLPVLQYYPANMIPPIIHTCISFPYHQCHIMLGIDRDHK